ncbi:MAG: 7-cyano-7-deazaguanine synthase QueC [Spirochaetota bacterium]|jgi:7-cyano-7-deazaguanine synthase|nr:7-cyano-7-deazaguanine synthase QueC [Spirochaetota bacterium]
MENAVLLMSGGLDSTTVLAWAVDKGYRVYALSFDYGQRHRAELERAMILAKRYAARAHHSIRLDPLPFCRSPLTGAGELALDRSRSEIGHGLAESYVPARNLIFLSMAAAFAEKLPARAIMIGVNSVDYSGYPDCRPEFIEAFTRAANLGTSAAFDDNAFVVHAPLMRLSKAEIIRLGISLGVDYGETVSCYQADSEGRACGHCDACILRRDGFAEAGVADPTRYI